MPFRGLASSERGRNIIRFIESWSLAVALALGGSMAGYALSEYRLAKVVMQLNAEHNAEITRIQSTNQQIQVSTERVLAALAAQVKTAAQQANVAGQSAAAAADQSAQAAAQAKSAAAVVRKAHTAIIVTPSPGNPASATVPEPERVNLNSAIERANKRIMAKKR